MMCSKREKMSVEQITKANYKEILSSETPAIIDFWASWCGPCQMMGPVFEKLSKEYEGRLRFAKVDVDSERELAEAFRISGIPTLVLVHKDKEVGRFSGFMPKEALAQKIDSMLSTQAE